MAEYPLTFTNTWSYNGLGDYWNLATFKNTSSNTVKVTSIVLYLGTGKGTFSYGSFIYGQGKPIYNWIQLRDETNGNFLATSPNNESTGQIISKQVGNLYYAPNDLYYPNKADCVAYTYNTFTITWDSDVVVKIPAGHTMSIKITGGGFSGTGRGVLCVDNTRGSINVEPVDVKVTLTLNYNYSGSSNKTMTVPVNNSTSLGSNPTRTGYTFVGWFTASTGGEDVGNSYIVTENTTLYAHWKVNKYKIIYYNPDDSEFETRAGISYGATINITSNIPYWEGHIFLSWNTKKGGSGTSYASGNKITMPASDLELYSQWKDAPPIWVYSTDDHEWHNAATPPTSPNTPDYYRPIYQYNASNSQWEENQKLNIYNKGWEEVT